MQKFIGHIITRDGKKKEITGWASSKEEMTLRLRHQNAHILSVQKSNEASVLGCKRSPWNYKKIIHFSFQMSIVLESGLSMPTILTMLESNSSQELPIPQIRQGLADGKALSEILEELQFPKAAVTLLHAGEESGTLAESFQQIHRYYTKAKKRHDQRIQTLLYPVFVCSLLLVFLAVVVGWILPTFEVLFAQMHMPMPTGANILLQGKEVVCYHPFYTIGGIACMGGLIYRFWSHPHWRAKRERMLWSRFHENLSLYGRMYSQVLYMCALLLQAGLTLTESLRIVTPLWSNSYARGRMEAIIEKLQTGISLAEAMKSCEMGTPFICEMIAAGEYTGELGTMMMQCSQYLEKESLILEQKKEALLEPCIMTIVGIVIGAIVLSLMIPLFEALTSVGTM